MNETGETLGSVIWNVSSSFISELSEVREKFLIKSLSVRVE